MIKLFRQIRQNLLSGGQNSPHDPVGQAGRYFKYAIGEIVLVVIGILIALSINNWNEARKNDRKQTLLVSNIIEDLSLDSAHINRSLHELADQIHVIDAMIARALDSVNRLNYDSMGYVRYSSDFRPITQRNHAASVSSLENEFIRELLQTYFIKEDFVLDIFKEYEDIIHNKIRPYLSDVGMHNLQSLYREQLDLGAPVLLQTNILEEQLGNVKFQQLLFERRLKTASFQKLLSELKMENRELIKILSSGNNQ